MMYIIYIIQKKIIRIIFNKPKLTNMDTLFILLYNSLLLPHLNYCNIICGNNYNYNINDVYNIYNSKQNY